MASSYSPQEKQYYDQLFAFIDKQNTGILPGQDAYPFLTSSNLPTTTLGEVWALADQDNNGFLTKEAWYKAARLIGWMQKGGVAAVEESLATKPGPLPTFDQGPRPPVQPQLTGQPPLSAHNTGAGSVFAPSAPAALPPLSPADRAKFTRLFANAGPSNGLVQGDKARDVFVKSGLSYEKLGQIWNLADTQDRGSLDLTDFIIGMYLIQSCMSNPSLVLPPTLPQGTYEAASGGRAPPPQHGIATSPISRQHTGGAAASPVRPQYTGGAYGGGILQPQGTGQSAGSPARAVPPPPSRQFTAGSLPGSAFGAGNTPQRQLSGFAQPGPPWDVTPQAKATSDSFFSSLDPQGKGVIDGDVAVPFMLQSQLDEGTLANIWDLADIRKEGKLTRDEFAVAMHLIQAKLAGQDPPASLPLSLVPPSLREDYGGAQQAPQGQQGQSSTTRDLFDLLGNDDEPTPTAAAASKAAPAPAPAPQQQQPPSIPPRNPSHQQTPHQAQSPPPFAGSGSFLPQPPPPPARRQVSGGASQVLSPAATGQGQSAGSPFGSAFAPAPRGSDLLGDDGAAPASSVPDRSAEFGNAQNALSNTTRSLSTLESQHTELDASATSSAAQLAELKSKLSDARTRHEAETRAVAELRERVSSQAAELTSLQAQVITAESDVSALRSEKTELEQALLRDKEEVRGLQRKMKEVEDEKKGLGLVLERLRKEARQQKGMLSIAKKQVSTAEGGRDGVQGEIRGVEKEIEDDKAAHAAHIASEREATASAARSASPFSAGAFSPNRLANAAGVPLPHTPQALSPAATGVSTRSNNPFDRFTARALPAQPQANSGASTPAPAQEQPKETSPGTSNAALLGVGAAATAAAGAVVAGASTLYDKAKHAVSDEPEHDPELDASQQGERGLGGVGGESGVKGLELSEAEKGQAGETDPFGAPVSEGTAAQDDKTPLASAAPTTGADVDPFGAPVSKSGADVDPFGAPVGNTDPFGAPIPVAGGEGATSFDNFDDGFGDSFGGAPVVAAGAGVGAAATAAAVGGAEEGKSKGADAFDDEFAEFDAPASAAPATAAPDDREVDATAEAPSAEPSAEATAAPAPEPESTPALPASGIPAGLPKSAVPSSLVARPEAERSASTQAIAPSSEPSTPFEDGSVPGGYHHRSEQSSVPGSRSSTPGLAGAAGLGAAAAAGAAGAGVARSSGLGNEVTPGQEEAEGESSDEEEGPEDLDAPRREWTSREGEPTTAGEGVFDEPASGSVPQPQQEEQQGAQPAQEREGETEPQSEGILSSIPAAISSLPPALGAFVGITSPPTNAAPSEDHTPKTRRSAPPPPAAKSASASATATPTTGGPGATGGLEDEFDPFGAQTSTFSPAQDLALPPGAAPAVASATPKTASFDEDEFDFSDLPPAQVEPSTGAASGTAFGAAPGPGAGAVSAPGQGQGFDDEFASFDDDFDTVKPEEVGGFTAGGNGSENSSGNKSYEMVSPQSAQSKSGRFDEWGFGTSGHHAHHHQGQEQASSGEHGQQQQQPAQALSFDDAFGGDFEPATTTAGSHSQPTDGFEESFAPPPGPPPAPSSAPGAAGTAESSQKLNPPPMPERRPSTAQPDDIEDVKKLCAMGFSRSLAVEALAANGYDFQKALNVLL
ncbi:hypothetical protein IAT38_002961 [Cryptococcus sp. DSM 104549]